MMLGLVLTTCLVLAIGGWLLLFAPAVDSMARARISQISALVEGQVTRLTVTTERLLQLAADWLASGTLPLDHLSLNQRFIPLLKQTPEYATMLVADTAGSEWMLTRRADGGWTNRLSGSDDQPGTRRYLQWSDTQTLEGDEQRETDYETRSRPWFRKAMETGPGEVGWTEIYRFFTGQEPGVTAVRRVEGGPSPRELVVGLDLRLLDIARYLNSLQLGQRGLAVLLTKEGRILGLTRLERGVHQPLRQDLVFRPVLGVDLGPLQQGVDLWLERGQGTLQDRLLVHDFGLWHVGFRRLNLGDQGLWLGVFLPLSELIPGVSLQLLILAAGLALGVLGVGYVGLRTARRFSRPLEALAAESQRIGTLDFTPAPPLDSDLLELQRLALAQETMRGLIADAHRELLDKNAALQSAQGRLIQAAKLESVGRLAAGVAHEVKNPLAIIQMGVDFLRGEMPREDAAQAVLQDMEESVSRADRIVRGLLDFSRAQRLKLAEEDINQVLESAVAMVEHELRQRDIRVIRHLGQKLPCVPMDADKLRQVFVNLVLNSAQAMGHQGSLEISSDCRTLTSHSGLERSQTDQLRSGDRVLWVEIADSGPGIDQDSHERLFDPFYTTKDVGQGTGLGLSVSRSLVDLHQGSIDIRNRPGGGASAVVMLKIPEGACDEEETAGSG
jgi:signal transduction histidine kinase